MERHKRRLTSLGIIGFVVVAVVLYIVVAFMLSMNTLITITEAPPDNFGKGIRIPKSMNLEEPIESVEPRLELAKYGAPEIYLVGSGGRYDVNAYINPKASGFIYLKVVEATTNTSLSAEQVRAKSMKYAHWSVNTQEQFRYNSTITIYEGDFSTYYPARFEIWFVPDSGKPERKLLQKNFRITGWER